MSVDLSRYKVAANPYIEAISAMESTVKNMPKQTIKNIQTAPAVPPFAKPKTPVLFQSIVSEAFQIASLTSQRY
jgi:hypothetical protein